MSTTRILTLSAAVLLCGCASHHLHEAETHARAEAAAVMHESDAHDAMQAGEGEDPFAGMSDEERAAAEAMMMQWEAHMTPGPHHAHMAERVGEYDAHFTWWQMPGGPGESARGVTTASTILDGLFLKEVTRSDEMIPGHMFHGIGITGWDNTADKLVMVWIDNAGSGMYYAEGGCNADCSEQVAEGWGTDMMTGTTQRYRYVTKDAGPDGLLFEMWVQGDDGEFWRMMECRYTRRG